MKVGRQVSGRGERTHRTIHKHGVRQALDRVLASANFDATRRSREFLRFIVEETLAGRGEGLTQDEIATRVFGRRGDFDPTLDPIVRIQAGRLRRSLERYYLLGGTGDTLRIELPRGTYAPVFRQLAESEGESAEGARTPAASVGQGDDWPSLVLSPFENLTRRPEPAETANRVGEVLAAELGRYRDVRVLLQDERERLEPSRRPAARFALAGRILGDDVDLRVTARLVDLTTGEQIWADEYHTAPEPGRWSGSPDDVARVIAARVAAEHGVIVQALAGEYRRRSAAEVTSYRAILGSYHFFFTRDPRDLPPAVEALRRVLKEDPELSPAWMMLARLCLANLAFEVTGMETPIDQTMSHAQNAVRLDASGTRARCVLAAALLVKGELAAGRDQMEQALRLNSASLVYLENIGWLMAMLGDWERGIALARQAVERNPHCMPLVSFGFWADHLRRGQLDEAYQAALDLRDPIFFWRALMRACCLGHLGRSTEASVEVADLLRQKPEFPERGRILIGRYIKEAELQERIAAGLAKAGLALA